MIKPIGGALWQWDTGRSVEISARPGCTVDEVHFYNGTTENALVGVLHDDGEKITAQIPNLFLQSANNLVVYSIMVDDDGEQTTESLTVCVNKKPKPDDYVYTETEVLTWKALDDRIKAIEEGGIPGGGECNIPRIETAVNGQPKINLRDLESGSYILYGYFEPYADSHISISADNSLISVIRKDAGSHIICLDPLNAKVVFFEVLVDTTQESGFAYTKKVISLLDVYDIMNSGESACNVPRFESSEATETGIRNLRELDSGVYILDGYWNAYPGADTYMPFDNRFVTVEKQTAGSQLFVYETLNAKVIFHEILVDETTEDGFTHTRTTIDLLSLHNTVTELSDCKIQLFGNETHNGSFVDLNGIISAPIVGSIDGNVVTLSGDLAKGTYEVKYMLADGTAVNIGTVEVV